MDWQSIESAPKDGTCVLLWAVEAEWDAGIDVYSPRTIRPGVIAGQYDSFGEWVPLADFRTGASLSPTHWMPLPPPPHTQY